MTTLRTAGLIGTAMAAIALAAPVQATQDARDQASTLVLPAPVGEIPLVAPEVVTPERRRTTFVPGPVRDDERIAVHLGPDGAPARVVVTQRLELTGTGDFAIRERGPALRVTALDGTTAPVILRGTVVWQGFVPGRRLLAADLELDAAREALLLPLRVELAWAPAPGGAASGPGGDLPSAGRLTVRLVNQTSRPDEVPTGLATASAVAAPLDTLRAHADTTTSAPPPAAGRGLPTTIPVTDLGTRPLEVAAPLRISGSVTVRGVSGVAVTGAGTEPTAAGDGAEVSGVLAGSTELTLDVPEAGRLVLDLTVVPALDPRRLVPPDGAPSWAAWAATSPDEPARRAALDTLVEAAAASARADEVAPYLGHPGPGQTTTEFRYTLAAAPGVRAVRAPLTPRPIPIALTTMLIAGAVYGGARLWLRL
ncbi:MAG TPA: hypothetical protein VNA14_12480 [Mycobacteriales bacterium]|nr:hypothetical protein [Mycobacteriales bacterium]